MAAEVAAAADCVSDRLVWKGNDERDLDTGREETSETFLFDLRSSFFKLQDLIL